MKKLLSILFVLISFYSFGQNVRVIQGYNPTTMQPGVIYRDTSISLPYTANKYITGFATVGSLPDTTRGYFSGTTNRIAYNSTTGVFDIANLYVGQTSLTTLGTIGTGVWNGTAIGAAYGGNPTGGTINQVLAKNSSANYDYSWVTATSGGTPAGSSTYIQYNTAGAFDGSSTFTYKPSVTASSLMGKNFVISPTLTAAANNDTLISVDIQPTYINGAFTGVQDIGLRVNAPAIIGGNFRLNSTATDGFLQIKNTGLSIRRGDNITRGTSIGMDAGDNFVINGANSGLAYKESGTTEFYVNSSGAGNFNSSISAPFINATSNSGINGDFYNNNGGGTLKLSNSNQIGGSGFLYGTQSAGGTAFGIKLSAWTGFAYADRWYLYQSSGAWSSSATEVPSAILNASSTNRGFLPPVQTNAQKNARGVSTGTIAGGSGYTNGSFTLKQMTGGTGTGSVSTITVSGGAVTAVTISYEGAGYVVGDVLSSTLAGGSGFTYTITAITAPATGLTIYCTDCTATDGSTGVTQTYNGSTWKNYW
jgi:hypothetical protein